MSAQVHWVLELAVKPGELDNLKTLMGEMVAQVRDDQPDTTHFEWFLSDDGATCHLYERYADSAAAMLHLEWFGQNFAERFLAVGSPTRFVVYGDPDEQVRATLGGFGAQFMGQIGGFAR